MTTPPTLDPDATPADVPEDAPTEANADTLWSDVDTWNAEKDYEWCNRNDPLN
jgi:hypothetical protein